MANLSEIMHIPVRSVSLPSRSHPNSLQLEAQLTKLKASIYNNTNNNLGAADTIQTGLTNLVELFISIDEFITHSPHTQQGFHHDHDHLNLVEDALERSVGLLDVCSTARDLCLVLKEQIQDLQSAFRRRRGLDSSIACNIQAYISFRKKAKKDFAKSLKLLKRMEADRLTFPGISDNQHLYTIQIMREANRIAISTFKSLLLFLSFEPVMKKTNCVSGWSLISKFVMHSSGFLVTNNTDGSSSDHKIFNEVDRVDSVVCTIYHAQIRKNADAKNMIDVQEVQRRLEKLDFSIKGIEGELHRLFKCLIQNRVSVLNLVTPS